MRESSPQETGGWKSWRLLGPLNCRVENGAWDANDCSWKLISNYRKSSVSELLKRGLTFSRSSERIGKCSF